MHSSAVLCQSQWRASCAAKSQSSKFKIQKKIIKKKLCFTKSQSLEKMPKIDTLDAITTILTTILTTGNQSSRYAQDMPPICPRYPKKVAQIGLKNAQHMPKISLIYAQDMPKICRRDAQDMPKVYSRYVQDMPKISPRYTRDMPEMPSP